MHRLLLALSLTGLVAVCAVAFVPTRDAAAQATCRAKCTEDEQACLKRTNNKGQCGNSASQCLAKCK